MAASIPARLVPRLASQNLWPPPSYSSPVTRCSSPAGRGSAPGSGAVPRCSAPRPEANRPTPGFEPPPYRLAPRPACGPPGFQRLRPSASRDSARSSRSRARSGFRMLFRSIHHARHASARAALHGPAAQRVCFGRGRRAVFDDSHKRATAATQSLSQVTAHRRLRSSPPHPELRPAFHTRAHSLHVRLYCDRPLPTAGSPPTIVACISTLNLTVGQKGGGRHQERGAFHPASLPFFP